MPADVILPEIELLDERRTVADIVDSVIEGLPPKPQAKCDRTVILAAFAKMGAADDVSKLKTVIEATLEDATQEKRKAFRAALGPTPIIFISKLSMLLDVDAPSPFATILPGEVLPGTPLLSEPLPEDTNVSASARETTRIATFPFEVLARGQERVRPPKFIRGCEPSRPALRRMCSLYSRERSLYPEAFLETIGLKVVLLCERLSYDGQERRDVPDLMRGTYFIDIMDREFRRSRHAFHHELWHMADFKLRGRRLEAPDEEWQALNPKGFTYGDASGAIGGTFMREPGVAELSSAPSEHFLNKYCTSSVAEDKAEVWACLMCYQDALKSPPLRAKARLIKRRAQALCGALDDQWWRLVRWHQLAESKEWERCPVKPLPEELPKGQREGFHFWRSFVSDEQRSRRPVPRFDKGIGPRPLLEHLGLETYAASFDDEGFEDVACLRDVPEGERTSLLVKDLGMEADAAARFAKTIDQMITPDEDL